jgi:hypothetical protein
VQAQTYFIGCRHADRLARGSTRSKGIVYDGNLTDSASNPGTAPRMRSPPSRGHRTICSKSYAKSPRGRNAA